MLARIDLSDKLIHFTKGVSWQEAYERLRKIIADRMLIAGNYTIRGGYSCVCFTEAPLSALAPEFLFNPIDSRYAPFGLMFDKSWVSAVGGRPVIYQPESEFEMLPEAIRWRHVRHEPAGLSPIDFSWEREWRVQCEALQFTPEQAVIVLPNRAWSNHLLSLHEYE
jgi:hypothetical protein